MSWRSEAGDGVLEHAEVAEQDKALRWRAIRGCGSWLGEKCGLDSRYHRGRTTLGYSKRLPTPRRWLTRK